jgi:hypothetical protein
MADLQRNAVGSDLRFTCRASESGAVINLTGGSVALRIRKPSKKALTKSTSLADATNGVISYVTIAGDLDEAGAYEVQGIMTLSGTVIPSAVVLIPVLDNIY